MKQSKTPLLQILYNHLSFKQRYRIFLPVFEKQHKPRINIQTAMVLNGFNNNHIASINQNVKKKLPN